MLNCEAHRCQQLCHRGPCQPCPLSPRTVRTCPCGQTPLTKLLELGYAERRSCSDPVPSCGKLCSKPLACGSSGMKQEVLDRRSILTLPELSSPFNVWDNMWVIGLPHLKLIYFSFDKIFDRQVLLKCGKVWKLRNNIYVSKLIPLFCTKYYTKMFCKIQN